MFSRVAKNPEVYNLEDTKSQLLIPAVYCPEKSRAVN